MLAAQLPATESDLINFQFAVYSSPLPSSPPLHPYLSSPFLLSSQLFFYPLLCLFFLLVSPISHLFLFLSFPSFPFVFSLMFLFFHAPKLHRPWLPPSDLLFFQQGLFLFSITSFYFPFLFYLSLLFVFFLLLFSSFFPLQSYFFPFRPCFLSTYLLFSQLFLFFPFLPFVSFPFLVFPFPPAPYLSFTPLSFPFLTGLFCLSFPSLPRPFLLLSSLSLSFTSFPLLPPQANSSPCFLSSHRRTSPLSSSIRVPVDGPRSSAPRPVARRACACVTRVMIDRREVERECVCVCVQFC